jgi:hypothetical protein
MEVLLLHWASSVSGTELWMHMLRAVSIRSMFARGWYELMGGR